MNYLQKITSTGRYDLHTHSTYSDGTYTPLEIIETARQNGLHFLSITDHDTCDAYITLTKNESTNQDYTLVNEKVLSDYFVDKTSDIAVQSHDRGDRPLIIVPGVEISTLYQNKKVDLLAYFIAESIFNLQEFLHEQQRLRHERNQLLITKLQKLGYPLPENFFAELPSSAGRVHAARFLVEKGYFSTISEAFDRLLLFGRPGFVRRQACSTEVAIRTVRAAGGIPVIAHPQLYGWCEQPDLLRKLLIEFKAHGLLGVEAYHSQAKLEQRKLIVNLARELNLETTGGSDFHGANKQGHDLYKANSF